MGGPKLNEATKTLYDRLGGDPFISLLTCAFFDELVENPGLKPFFQHISKSALKCHQVKLFRVIFGKEEEKPENEDILEFMLRTHTRLFRELGLDANHFDQVATCFVQGLQSFQTDQGLIDECVAILMPLRVVFEYGAQVAAKEKTMTKEELHELPKASPKTFGTDEPVVLPEYSKIEVPQWLPDTLGKHSSTSIVRAWTCDLTDRFGTQGDQAIADTFMDQPYMDHHVYLVAFLELAFLPEDVDSSQRAKALEIVMFPRGPKHAPLSKDLFDRMIAQFLLTCHKMGMSKFTARAAETKLRTFRRQFAEKTTTVGGIHAQHILLTASNKKKRRVKRRSKNSIRSEGGGAKHRSSSASLGSLTSLSLLDFDDSESCCSSTSLGSALTDCSTATGKSAKSSRSKSSKKTKRKGKGSSWSIFRSLMKSKTRKEMEPAIPTNIAV